MDIKKTPAPESELIAPVKSLGRRSWNFCKELWNDHDFWVRALAVKGGASAIVVAGVVGISYVVALPFIVATAAVVACSGLIGLGLYGVFLGATTGWDKLKEVYAKTISHKPVKEKTEELKLPRPKLSENPRIKKFLEKPLMQKLFNSRAWKTTHSLTQKQQDVFLAGMAGTGSLFWGVISALTLVTQIIVLPVVAVGSVLTFGTALAAGGLLTATYGLYYSAKSLAHSLGVKKKDDGGSAEPPTEAAAPQQQQAVTTEPQPQTAALAQTFAQAGEKAGKIPVSSPPQLPPAPPAT